MKTILDLSSYSELYRDSSILGKVKDRFKIQYTQEVFIQDLNLSIVSIRIPANVYPKAYAKNISIAKNIVGHKEVQLAPNLWRMIDYSMFSNYQKRLFAYSVVRSIKLFLRTNGKSINNSCIVVVDAADKVNNYIIKEICKVASNIVLVSNNIIILKKKRDMAIASYGVAPIITRDYVYAIQNADFIITSKDIDPENDKSNIWYIDDRFSPCNNHNLVVNNVLYNTPWNISDIKNNVQIIGAILNCIGGKDIEKDLKFYGIYLDRFGFDI